MRIQDHWRLPILVLIGMLLIASSLGGAVPHFAESGGIQLVVTAVNIAPYETLIRVEKEIDGVITVFEQMTSEQIAVLNVPAGGTCTVTGGPVPGRITPDPVTVALTQRRGGRTKTAELLYTDPGTIDQEQLLLSREELPLIAGETFTLEARILPENATDQDIYWSSSDENVASVLEGLVTAEGTGSAIITVSTDEGLEATCQVTVRSILSYEPLPVISVFAGDWFTLPSEATASFDDGTSGAVIVVWREATLVDGDQRMVITSPGAYEILGDVTPASPVVSIDVVVEGEPAVVPTHAAFDHTFMSLYVGHQDTLSIATLVPEDAQVDLLRWVNASEEVIELDLAPDHRSAMITGLAPGEGEVRLEGADGTLYDRCLVYVTIDPTVTDPAYIVATSDSSEVPVEQFATKEDVYIRGYGLQPGRYYVKVEDKGSRIPLGTGTYEVSGEPDETILFQLNDIAPFALTMKNNDEYFVSMSRDPRFPSGDDSDGIPLTFKDNFKITSPVPTGQIVVTVNGEPIGEDLFNSYIVGRDVILGREIKSQTVLETQYEDYLNPDYDPVLNPDEKLYTDEVKLLGQVQSDGTVAWLPPAEILKIGGYVLLMDVPEGFASNLDQVNPESEDGELLKEVHITRDGLIVREIVIMSE